MGTSHVLMAWQFSLPSSMCINESTKGMECIVNRSCPHTHTKELCHVRFVSHVRAFHSFPVKKTLIMALGDQPG